MRHPSGRFLKAFETATFTVVALGFLSLFVSEQVSAIGLILLASALFGAWGPRRWPPISDGAWRLMALGVVLILGVGNALGVVPSLSAAGILLIFLQVQRLYMRRDNRDYAYLYLLAFLQLLLGCVLTIVPAFALILLGYLIAVTWALLLFQLKVGVDGVTPPDGEAPPPPTSRWSKVRIFVLGEARTEGPGAAFRPGAYRAADGFLTPAFVAATTGVTLTMLVLTLGVFLAAPRLDLNLFKGESGPPTHVAGFSDTVSLGEVGEIQAGQRRVMRVRLEGPAADSGVPLYWRGAALDTFDGREWSLSRTGKGRILPGGGILNPPAPPEADLIQDITLEPLDTETLFALPRILALEAEVGEVFRGVTGALTLGRRPGRFQYKVYSRLDAVRPNALRGVGEDFPREMARVYLQLPQGLSPRLGALAADITQDARTQYDKVAAIEAFLSTTLTYTLSPQSQGESPVEDFLFRTQAGHCEYFASAMVLMARSLGYPARMVTGFAGGAWNAYGGYYTVSQGNAHAWVEVYFNRYGWQRFDPTPAAITDEMGAPQGVLAGAMDYLESRWYFFVLDFGLQDQLDFIRNAVRFVRFGSVFEEGFDAQRREGPAEGGGAGGILKLLGALGLVGAFALWAYRRRGGGGGDGERAPLRGEPATVRRYLKARARLDGALASLGFERGEGETPLERALRAEAALGEGGHAVAEAERAYYGIRYGGRAVTASAVAAVEALVAGLKAREG